MRVKYIIVCFLFIVSVIFCNKKENVSKKVKKYNTKENVYIKRDSLNNTEYIYKSYSKMKNEPFILNNEIIYFYSNGKINSDKSVFVEIKGNNIYYNSPYYLKYTMGENRFVIFRGNDSIKKDFSNIEKLKLKEFSFDEKGIIQNYKNIISKRGLIEETIVLDTLIETKKGNKKIIRTVRTYIEVDNLLINHIKNETR